MYDDLAAHFPAVGVFQSMDLQLDFLAFVEDLLFDQRVVHSPFTPEGGLYNHFGLRCHAANQTPAKGILRSLNLAYGRVGLNLIASCRIEKSACFCMNRAS